MARRAFRRAGAGRNRLTWIVGGGDETQRFRLFPQRLGLRLCRKSPPASVLAPAGCPRRSTLPPFPRMFSVGWRSCGRRAGRCPKRYGHPGVRLFPMSDLVRGWQHKAPNLQVAENTLQFLGSQIPRSRLPAHRGNLGQVPPEPLRRPLRRPRQCQALWPSSHRQQWLPATSASRRSPNRRQPDVRRNLVQRRPPAAIDDDRDLRPEPCLPVRLPRCSARIISAKRSRVDDLVRIEPGQRAGLHRNAGAHRNAQPIDGCGETVLPILRQAADLQATARRDLDDAVAVCAPLLRRARSRAWAKARRPPGSAGPAVRRRSASAPTGQGRRRAA